MILHLFGIDHLKLTYPFQGHNFRLTDIHGELVKGIFGVVELQPLTSVREYLDTAQKTPPALSRRTLLGMAYGGLG